MPGYGNDSNPENITYQPESKTFKAMIRYGDKQTVSADDFAGMQIPRGTVSIKVQEDAREYINNGSTEKVDLDGKSFKVATSDSVKDHFGYQLYVYFLEEIK